MDLVTQTNVRRAAAGSYDRPTIVFHWLTAALVIIQFATADIWPLLQRGTAPRLGLIGSHLTLGIVLSALVVLRLFWRVLFGERSPVALPRPHRIAATVVHGVLYGLLILQVVLGYLLGWASDKPIAFLGIPAIPPLIVVPGDSRHMVGMLHEDVAWIIVGVAVAHAGAALFHHHVLRDGVFRSMAGWKAR